MNREEFYNHNEECFAKVFEGLYFQAKNPEILNANIDYAIAAGFFAGRNYFEDYHSKEEVPPLVQAKFYLGYGEKHEYYQWDYKDVKHSW